MTQVAPIPPDVISTLSVRWLESFQKAARSGSRPSVLVLFHPHCILWGVEKDGPIDWPISNGFEIDIPSCKIVPSSPYAFVIASWKNPSPVVGGTTHRGRVTFLFTVEEIDGKRHFVCAHAHFSEGSTDSLTKSA